MTASKAEAARQAPPPAGAPAAKSRGKGWIWLLLLLLLAALGTAGWLYWPKLLPTFQKLPLVGRFLPSAPAAEPPAPTPAPSDAPPATPPAEVPSGDGGTGGQDTAGETPPPTQAELDARAAELDKLAKSLADERLKLEEEKAALAGAQRLAGIYRQMKPADAATIFSRLSDDDVVPILLALPNDQVAQILAALDSARAAQLTRRIKALATP